MRRVAGPCDDWPFESVGSNCLCYRKPLRQRHRIYDGPPEGRLPVRHPLAKRSTDGRLSEGRFLGASRRSMAPRLTHESTVLSSHPMIPAASRRDTPAFASSAAISASSRSWRTISLTASTGIHQRWPARTAPRGTARRNGLACDAGLGCRLSCGHVANRLRWRLGLSSCSPGGELRFAPLRALGLSSVVPATELLD